MKTLKLMGLIATAIVSISATALAYTDTDFIVIGRLEASSNSSNGFRVYPAAGYTIPEVSPCSKHDYAEMQSTGPTTVEKDMMARQLQTAFFGTRKVRLRLDGCGVNDRPAYRIVTLDQAQ
jgi:hypothetical protein